jgi:hypothetical protein
MFLLAALAAAANPAVQARASVRIVKSGQVNRQSWERSSRRRQVIVREGGREVAIRLIDFE